MRTILTITMGLLFASVLLVATRCAPGETPAQAPAPVAGKGTPAVSARAPWQESWERTLREARKEGSVVVYTTYGTEWRAALAEAMSQKYGVAVESVTARSAEVAERVMREQKNKLYQADVVVVGSSQYQMTFQPEAVLQSFEKALTLPEVVDPKVWWRGKLPWLDPDTKTYLQFYEYVSPPILINTDLIKPEEVRAWKDLLNPRWKGRILMDDPTIASGRGVKIMSMLAYTIMDWDFINNLVKQEPVLTRDNRLEVEWVARGKFPVLIGPFKETVSEFARAGAPLSLVVPSEGTYLEASSGFVSHPRGAPHPNAASIFINFLLTKEGQTLSSKATGHQSTRVDVPTDHLEPIIVRQPGVKYLSTTDKGFLEKEVELKNKVAELFKPLLK